MKILLLDGSPRPNDSIAAALGGMKAVFTAEGLKTERVRVGNRVIRGYIAYGECARLDRYAFDDLVSRLAPKLGTYDGLVVDSPVYYTSTGATLVALLTRLFHSTPSDKTMKMGAAVATARRDSLSSAFDELSKFFTISGVPMASNQYWNSIHGRLPGETTQDAEGLQTMRTLTRNMAFLVKSTTLGRGEYGLPEQEELLHAHFIR